MTPISDHCRDLLERLGRHIADVQDTFHTHTPDDAGHDPGDEDPNAWRTNDGTI